MSLKSIAVSLSFLWRCTSALPAGPSVFLNDSTPFVPGFHTSDASYRLIDTYDASNWLSKFDVQDVSDLCHISYAWY
jgi:hypothetical protein